MFSLITATLNRVDELERLLESLSQQTYREFELRVVDQNQDERLLPVLRKYPQLSIRHLRSKRGLSRARNVALPLAVGDIVAFPDDDCWYPPDLLANVDRWFRDHPDFAGLFTCVRDAEGKPIGPRWPANACRCVKENIWNIAISTSGFLRKGVADEIGPFDDNIGVGAATAYQSGEETDYFLRTLERGHQLWYESRFTVHHPTLHSPERLRRTTYTYALGGGYVQRIHGYSLRYFANQVMRSFGGAVVSLFKADIANSHIYLLRAAGQLRGYFWGPRDMARYRAQSD